MLGGQTKRNQEVKYKNLREAEATQSFSSGKRKEKGEKRKLTPGRLPEEKHGLQAQVGVGSGCLWNIQALVECGLQPDCLA